MLPLADKTTVVTCVTVEKLPERDAQKEEEAKSLALLRHAIEEETL